MRFTYHAVKKYILLVIVVLTASTAASRAWAQTATPTTAPSSSQTSSVQNRIKEYQEKIDELQGQAKTLNSQISLVDNQISLSELKIRDAQDKISKLEDDIQIAQKKIGDLEGDIEKSTKAMVRRVSAVYAVGTTSPWEVFLTSSDMSNFMTRLKYLKMVQIADKKAIYAAEQAKVNYEAEKEMFQDKQEEATALKQKLEDFNTQLAADKKKKQDLLSITKSSEAEYQRRLSDATRELAQIQQAAKFLVTTEPRDVKRGDAIGLMGATGYAFGAHLHYGVYNATALSNYNYYSGYEDPANTFEPRDVDWQTDCSGDPHGMSSTGRGSFGWPMSVSGLHISQGYGHTCYSDVYYKGQPHPAYDMYNNSDIVIYAVEAGKAYICRNCTGDGGNGVFLFHSNGKMTLYWHLQ